MYKNQNIVGKKNNTHRKTNSDKNMVVSYIKLAPVLNFYRKLFSHVDMLNTLVQDEIERNVKSIETTQLKTNN